LVQLHECDNKTNARAIEGALQARYHGRLPLGLRLWKEVDKGGKHDGPDDLGKSHKVFLTMSRKICVKDWVMHGDELDLGKTLAKLGVQINYPKAEDTAESSEAKAGTSKAGTSKAGTSHQDIRSFFPAAQ